MASLWQAKYFMLKVFVSTQLRAVVQCQPCCGLLPYVLLAPTQRLFSADHALSHWFILRQILVRQPTSVGTRGLICRYGLRANVRPALPPLLLLHNSYRGQSKPLPLTSSISQGRHRRHPTSHLLKRRYLSDT
jgi:hypothetical protein